jgi:hypothetical protein
MASQIGVIELSEEPYLEPASHFVLIIVSVLNSFGAKVLSYSLLVSDQCWNLDKVVSTIITSICVRIGPDLCISTKVLLTRPSRYLPIAVRYVSGILQKQNMLVHTPL